MKKLLIITIAAALMLTACGQPQTNSSNIENSEISSNSAVENSLEEVSSNENTAENTEELTQLTTEQKIEDFEQYFEVMTKYNPTLEIEKEDFGLDFEAKKDFYLEKIKETKNDFEFYALMTAIHDGGHLGHHEWVDFTKDPDFVTYNNGYFLINTPNIFALNNKMAKSMDKYGEETYKKYKGNIHSFLYISNDEYICVNDDSSLKGCILFEINNKPVSESVGSYLSIEKPEFDENKRLYRESLFFNEKDGESVKIKLKTPDGEIIERDVFVNPTAEYASCYYGDFKYININENSKKEPLMTHINKENNYSYIWINTFGNTENEWAEKLKENAAKVTADVDNIIVDLRGNGGGGPYTSFGLTYPLFHDKEATLEFSFTLDDDTRDFFGISLGHWEKDYYTMTTEVNEEGTNVKTILKPHGNENSPKNKNIYYLINYRCGSGTEQYPALIKKNKLGTLIGTKSSGDGFVYGTSGYPLKNSGIVFVHTPHETFNPDGTSNTIYGTTPDIYCWQSMEDYQKRIEMAQNGENLYTFENMLQWDTTLKRAVEEITK